MIVFVQVIVYIYFTRRKFWALISNLLFWICIIKSFLMLNGIEKIIVDNSVRYIPRSEQSREKDIKPNSIKHNSNPRTQNKNI